MHTNRTPSGGLTNDLGKLHEERQSQVKSSQQFRGVSTAEQSCLSIVVFCELGTCSQSKVPKFCCTRLLDKYFFLTEKRCSLPYKRNLTLTPEWRLAHANYCRQRNQILEWGEQLQDGVVQHNHAQWMNKCSLSGRAGRNPSITSGLKEPRHHASAARGYLRRRLFLWAGPAPLRPSRTPVPC